MVTWRSTQTENSALFVLDAKMAKKHAETTSQFRWRVEDIYPRYPRKPCALLKQILRSRGPKRAAVPFTSRRDKSPSPTTWKCCASWWLPTPKRFGKTKKKTGQMKTSTWNRTVTIVVVVIIIVIIIIIIIIILIIMDSKIAMFLGYNPHKRVGCKLPQCKSCTQRQQLI